MRNQADSTAGQRAIDRAVSRYAEASWLRWSPDIRRRWWGRLTDAAQRRITRQLGSPGFPLDERPAHVKS